MSSSWGYLRLCRDNWNEVDAQKKTGVWFKLFCGNQDLELGSKAAWGLRNFDEGDFKFPIKKQF